MSDSVPRSSTAKGLYLCTLQSRGLSDGLYGAGRRDGPLMRVSTPPGLRCDILCVVSGTMSGTMSWDVRDAIVLIDQLLENLGPVSSKADEVVGQANILWQQEQQSEALELLLDFTQAQSSNVSEALPTLHKAEGPLGEGGRSR